MSGDERFSLAAAKRAVADDQLAEWVGEFLASPGSSNAVLAAALALRGTIYLGPIRFPLHRLTPMAGPDGDDVIVPVAKTEWESDVKGMVHSVEQGWQPPPLLVSHHDGGFFLEDGNHRCESLLQAGSTHAWTILLFGDEVERDRFLTES